MLSIAIISYSPATGHLLIPEFMMYFPTSFLSLWNFCHLHSTSLFLANFQLSRGSTLPTKWLPNFHPSFYPSGSQQGRFAPLGGIWQCPQTSFLMSTGDMLLVPTSRDQECSKHPTMHRTAPTAPKDPAPHGSRAEVGRPCSASTTTLGFFLSILLFLYFNNTNNDEKQQLPSAAVHHKLCTRLCARPFPYIKCPTPIWQ